MLLNECVMGQNGQAGIIKGIGKQRATVPSGGPVLEFWSMLNNSAGTGGNVGVGIKRYHPEHVECGGPGRFQDGCRQLVVSTAETSPSSSPHSVLQVLYCALILRASACTTVPMQCSQLKV